MADCLHNWTYGDGLRWCAGCGASQAEVEFDALAAEADEVFYGKVMPILDSLGWNDPKTWESE